MADACVDAARPRALILDLKGPGKDIVACGPVDEVAALALQPSASVHAAPGWDKDVFLNVLSERSEN